MFMREVTLPTRVVTPMPELSHRWNGSTWQALGSALDNYVYAITVEGPAVYVGGDFTNAGGDANADKIARWDTSELTPVWNALGSGLSNDVNTIAVVGHDTYVGGSFINAGGIANADRIARWDGTKWYALGVGLNDTVNAIAVQGEDIYVGGIFYEAGGVVNANRVARWNTDTSTWHALGSGLNDVVNAIVVEGPNIYVAVLSQPQASLAWVISPVGISLSPPGTLSAAV